VAQVPAPLASTPAPAGPARYELAGTELRTIHSELTGKDHLLIIGLPPSFDKDRARRYPTLYLLDGQWDFTLVSALSGGLRYDQVLPEMLIVGFSYAGTAPDYEELRASDYVPTRAQNQEGKFLGGGASAFLRFVEEVPIVLAEREYRADPGRRMLAGSSFGGLFALYTLLEKPELFQSYVAISPSAGWDNGWLLRREREFRGAHPALERRLWLSIGESESPGFVAEAKQFFRQIEASRYRGLELKTYTVPGERHSGVKPEAFNRALRYAAEPWMPAVSKQR
jgi:predicted alpha/beta superfamily hydrolase